MLNVFPCFNDTTVCKKMQALFSFFAIFFRLPMRFFKVFRFHSKFKAFFALLLFFLLKHTNFELYSYCRFQIQFSYNILFVQFKNLKYGFLRSFYPTFAHSFLSVLYAPSSPIGTNFTASVCRRYTWRSL